MSNKKMTKEQIAALLSSIGKGTATEEDVVLEPVEIDDATDIEELIESLQEQGFETEVYTMSIEEFQELMGGVNAIVDADEAAIPEDANPLNIFWNTPGSRNN